MRRRMPRPTRAAPWPPWHSASSGRASLRAPPCSRSPSARLGRWGRSGRWGLPGCGVHASVRGQSCLAALPCGCSSWRARRLPRRRSLTRPAAPHSRCWPRRFSCYPLPRSSSPSPSSPAHHTESSRQAMSISVAGRAPSEQPACSLWPQSAERWSPRFSRSALTAGSPPLAVSMATPSSSPCSPPWTPLFSLPRRSPRRRSNPRSASDH
mmetsp:Transcript_24684/g.79707  ORF Transcript_24684/g.79707 Transcript_24684/m.79707 type:complete len:210 (-) Transcript_24684:1217-1846(-)